MSDLGFPTIPGTEPAYNVDTLQVDTDPETMRRQYYAQTLAAQQQQQQQPQTFVPSAAETPGTAVVAPAPVSIEASADTGYYGGEYDDDYGDPGESTDFYDSVQQGSVLVGFALIGQVADQWLKERTGAAGYGPILGAATGNALNTVIAASDGGAKAGAKALGGALLPMLPLVAAVGLKKEISGGTRIALLLSSAGLLGASLYMKKQGKK